MKKSIRILTLSFLASATLATAGVAYADPEQAYQAGKTASGQFEGSNKVDDRDWEQRTRDYVRDKGAGKDSGFWDQKTDTKDSETTDSDHTEGNK